MTPLEVSLSTSFHIQFWCVEQWRPRRRAQPRLFFPAFFSACLLWQLFFSTQHACFSINVWPSDLVLFGCRAAKTSKKATIAPPAVSLCVKLPERKKKIYWCQYWGGFTTQSKASKYFGLVSRPGHSRSEMKEWLGLWKSQKGIGKNVFYGLTLLMRGAEHFLVS